MFGDFVLEVYFGEELVCSSKYAIDSTQFQTSGTAYISLKYLDEYFGHNFTLYKSYWLLYAKHLYLAFCMYYFIYPPHQNFELHSEA